MRRASPRNAPPSIMQNINDIIYNHLPKSIESETLRFALALSPAYAMRIISAFDSAPADAAETNACNAIRNICNESATVANAFNDTMKTTLKNDCPDMLISMLRDLHTIPVMLSTPQYESIPSEIRRDIANFDHPAYCVKCATVLEMIIRLYFKPIPYNHPETAYQIYDACVHERDTFIADQTEPSYERASFTADIRDTHYDDFYSFALKLEPNLPHYTCIADRHSVLFEMIHRFSVDLSPQPSQCTCDALRADIDATFSALCERA